LFLKQKPGEDKTDKTQLENKATTNGITEKELIEAINKGWLTVTQQT